jgi:hypothetical protein
MTQGEHHGAAFKLDPARLVYSLRNHNAHPPDFELVLLRDDAGLYESWVDAVNLMLLAELRRRAPDAIDCGPLFASSSICSTPSKRRWIARPRVGIDGRAARKACVNFGISGVARRL